MNERIKQLAEQARVQDRGYFIYQYGGQNGYQSVEKAIDLEKFTELIVKECFNIVDNYAVGQASKPETYLGESLYVSLKITDAAWKIKEHFGVE